MSGRKNQKPKAVDPAYRQDDISDVLGNIILKGETLGGQS